MQTLKNATIQGIAAMLFSATMLGMAPIFGKLALNAGMDTSFLVVLRTTLAALALWLLFGLFARQYLYIYPVGVVACFIAGAINGVGSIMFYLSLNFLDASLAQLLYATNPIILAMLLFLDGQSISRLTIFRLVIGVFAVAMITQGNLQGSALTGVLLMLGGAFMYALHLAVNQQTLRDVPPPTVTLYTLTAMALVVVPFMFWLETPPSDYTGGAWAGLAGLMVVTLLSRLTLFLGVRNLGSVQAALLGLSELVVSLVAAFLLLSESLSTVQWVGAALLMTSVGLVGFERDLGKRQVSRGWLAGLYDLIYRQADSMAPPRQPSADWQTILAEAREAQGEDDKPPAS